ncbi:MAG: cell division protein FtsX [Spirosomataceae bacterium]
MQKNYKLGSYPGLLITFSLTVALFLVAFCGWLALSSKQLVQQVKQNIEVQVYLDKEMTQIQTDSVRNIIAQKPYIQYQESVPKIRFISKEEIAKGFLKDTEEDYRSILGENPFRNAFSVRIKEQYFDEAQLNKIKIDLEQLKGVYEVDYAKDFVDSINKNANKAYLIISVIVGILLLAIIILVNNTIRLALYSQRFIIRSMQLVGATDWFIKKPFLVRGALQGVAAGIIACLLLFGLQQIAIREIDGLSMLQDYPKLAVLSGIVIFLGGMIGIFSAFQSVYRYLRMDLDELY